MGSAVTGAYLYILCCADGSYYVGTTRKTLDERIAEHNSVLFSGYTATRRPVALSFSEHFESITDAIAAERRVKGWSRAKKEALMRGDWGSIAALAQRRHPHPSRRPPSAGSSG
jgi:putative endonuclease